MIYKSFKVFLKPLDFKLVCIIIQESIKPRTNVLKTELRVSPIEQKDGQIMP